MFYKPVYTAPGCPRRALIQLWTGPALLNFSDRADTDELTPYSVFLCYEMCYDNTTSNLLYADHSDSKNFKVFADTRFLADTHHMYTDTPQYVT